MHTIRFRIKLTKQDEEILYKRFRLLWRIHNQLVKHAQKLMNVLRYDRTYVDLKKAYASVMGRKKGCAKAEKEHLEAEKKSITDAMNKRREDLGLTKSGLESYAKVMQKRFSHHLSSAQVQKEADRVWSGVRDVLFGKGKKLHRKRMDQMCNISQKSNENGVIYRDGKISWNGLEIPLDIDWENPYVRESMDHPVKYCEISRKAFNNGWRWYVILYLDGPAPKKIVPGDSISGMDPGVSSAAVWSETAITLEELAPECQTYNKQIAREQRLIDRQMRAANPGNYNEDGTIRKGKHPWVITKGCRKRKKKLRSLFRKKKEYTLHSHNHTLNRVMEDSVFLYAEKMNFSALAKCSKKAAERSEKASKIKAKDGTVKEVHKFKRKKRFGKSIQDRSPGLFVSRAKQKCAQYGGRYVEINTRAYKASQYRHDTGTYEAIPLSQRTKRVDGKQILRDPYSVFLLRFSNEEGTGPDRNKCVYLFDRFKKIQDALIAFTPGKHPACFGY